MFAMHPTLLVGPADWDAARLPKEEFIGRIDRFWRDADPGIAGLVVYGSPRDHAELAYLTHFTPKLEPAIALIPRAREPRLLVGGGANMIGAARPLTFVETLLPLRDTGRTIARWAGELGAGGLALVNGDAMAFRLRQEIEAALGAAPPDATGLVAAAMRRKSACELALIREACAGLQAAVDAMREAQRAGRGTTDTVLAGERAAWRRGAQDARCLFGRNGTLAPFTVSIGEPADPLQVHVAVRHGGYWAEGFVPLSRAEQPVARAADKLLDQAIELMRPGARRREIAEFFGRSAGPDGFRCAQPILHRPASSSPNTDRAHPVTRADPGGEIGLALPKPGCFDAAGEARFAASEVYTVRSGLCVDGGAAIVSAMIAITENGHEVLWRGIDA
jgi:hypothetical protein